jgi:hypothetical protein
MKPLATTSKALIMAAVLTITTVTPIGAQEAPDETTIPEEPSGDAGYFFYSGGPVRAKRARTQTTHSTFLSAAWINLSGSTLTYVVPGGTADTFNVAFSAECSRTAAGGNGYIRIAHRVGLFGPTTYLEPYSSLDWQVFCSSTTRATYKGNWVRRVGAGTHYIWVQFYDSGTGSTIVDNWTFELVVHD